MPIYEFECKKCEAHFEDLVQSSKDSLPLPICPICNTNEKVSKLFSTSYMPFSNRMKGKW